MSRRKSFLQLKAVPLLLLCIGYLSVIPFGAAAIQTFMPQRGCVAYSHSVIELLPILGLALIAGYSQAARGKKPWREPQIFWITSFLFNAGIFLFFVSIGSLNDVAKDIWLPFRFLQEAFQPKYKPEDLLSAVTAFSIYFVILGMPLVAVLSAIEARRAFRKPISPLLQHRRLSSIESPRQSAEEPFMSLKLFSISITCFSPDEPIDEARAELESRFDRTGTKGELRSAKNPSSQRFETNVWSRTLSKGETESPEETLESLMPEIESCVADLRRLVPNIEMIKLFCGASMDGDQGGIWLNPEFITQIERLGVHLVFDLYR